MAIETTSTLSLHLQDFYERTFLDNLKKELVFADFTRRVPVPRGFGPVVKFIRFARHTGSTTALTEGTVPTEVQLTDQQVSATVQQYGNYVILSDFVLATHLAGYNPFVEQAVEELSYMAKDSVDLLVRNAFIAPTGLNITYGGGKSATSAVVGSADVMTANDIRKVVRALKKRSAPKWDGSHYVGVIGAGQSFDLQSETATGGWMDVNKYTTVAKAEKGEIGKLFGARLIESENLSSFSQSGTVSVCPFFGKGAVAMADITEVSKGDRTEMKHIQLFIKDLGSAGTADPLSQKATIGYKFNMAAVRLDDDRVQAWVGGETA
jgi:N4-gp56 family major capsid protein